MDPNKTLFALRGLLANVRNGTVRPDEQAATLEVMAGAFEALDYWLSHGGFPPAAWEGTHDPND